MRKIIAALFTCCVITGMTMADELKINDNVPERYVVVKGDTLWDISKMFLADPWKWEDIWHINPQIENPHLIFPGDIIGLVMIDGQQQLTVIARGENANTLKITPDQADNGLVKLRPTARVTPILGAIPAISREHIEGFIHGNRILNSEELDSAPYIISGGEGRLILGAGDKVFARGEFDPDLTVYQIYKKGDKYNDPVTEEFLGYEAIDIGTASMVDLESDIATLRLQKTTQQVSIGYRVLKSDESLLETFFYPSEPPEDITGQILDVNKGVEFIGQFDIILLNVGSRESIAPGNVFRINRTGDQVSDPVTGETIQLPSEEGGLAMVFRTFEKTSYAIILEAKVPMRVGDPIVNPGF
ncbi:LysM peptidoglycan-binding domain-containing protein [Reinekea marinisedimentorum]|uniref:LysM domain-containing protein n=1 Tax=Reinekea marinisedimentorum TaxID=230495 RepID=A0A4V6NY57_9GAMM|nr:LysM peptidoglycan-binding domain-containing protein [Reinekea marinisedimentorum]TCS43893.1 LysM domain-containing protein [Reinekea marinisedimentorum]